MVGYVESMTDPSYAGQILVFTYPLIGNYGVPSSEAWESPRIQVQAIVVSELTPTHYRHTGQETLLAWCQHFQIPIFFGADTRAITQVIRKSGVVAGALVNQGLAVSSFPDWSHRNWVKEVSIPNPINYGAGTKTIIVVDCGMKNHMLHYLQQFPWKIRRVPYDYDYTQETYDGVFISNGPGDPTQCEATIQILQHALSGNKPIFGICLGSQLMGLAIGAKTFKMTFGHRAQNHPCLETATNRCYLTSQNHGYAIVEDSLPLDWQVSYRNLNDGTVQGIEHKEKPFFSVQFHPEAAPGPLDTQGLFQKFYELVTKN